MSGLPLSGMRIGLLTASISRHGGGVAEAVAVQARTIARLGATAEVFALEDEHAVEDGAGLAPAPVHLARVRGPRQIGFAPALGRALEEARLDLLHLHGIWMYPSRAAARWRQATARPYLISPHGMLERWIVSHGQWKKALARAGYERASWRAASAFHALTPAEAADIAREAGRCETLVIPNAGPPAGPAPAAGAAPTIVYLGRIHPKKNLAGLVAAWQRARLPAAARLLIAGWGDEADVARLRQSIAGVASIEFVGAVFGAAKQRLLDAARFVILPSFSEGLPMIVLEAWAAGKPTLMSAACNLGEGFAADAALDCGTDAGEIAAALEHALSLNAPQWLAMSGAAQRLANGPFSTACVERQWGEAYAALLAGDVPR